MAEPEETEAKSFEAAAERGHLGTLNTLLGERVWLRQNIDAALLASAKGGHVHCYSSMLAAGASASAMDKERRNSLHLVLGYGGGNVEIVRMAIANQAESSLSSFVNAKDKSRSTPLMYAAAGGYTSCVQELVRAGANLNKLYKVYKSEYNHCEMNALMIAAELGHLDTVLGLIKAGADVNQGSLEDDPLSLAATNGMVECMEALIKAGAQVEAYNPLAKAAGNGKTEAVKLLLKCGANIDANIDAQGGYDKTALMAALSIHWGWQEVDRAKVDEIVDTLLSSGADVNIPDFNGTSPLLRAVETDDLGLLKRLIQKGADILHKDEEFGNSALHAGCGVVSPVTRTRCLEYLLENYADKYNMNDFNRRGYTPLTHAAWLGSRNSLSTLLYHNANPNVRDQNGYTPLAWAIARKNNKVVKTLIQFGCDVNFEVCLDRRPFYMRNYSFGRECPLPELPMEIAAKYCIDKVVEMLWVAGAKLGMVPTWTETTMPQPQESPQVTDDDKVRVLSFIRAVSSHPRSLSVSCRTVIRHSLGLDIKRKVDQLCLPEGIKDFIILKELHDIAKDHVTDSDGSQSD